MAVTSSRRPTAPHRDLQVAVGGQLREARVLRQHADGEGLGVALRVGGRRPRGHLQANVSCHAVAVEKLPAETI